jgi:hypothetical protein
MKMEQEQCIYCGPKCYGGAAHWARKEDGSLHAERNSPEQLSANDATQGLAPLDEQDRDMIVVGQRSAEVGNPARVLMKLVIRERQLSRSLKMSRLILRALLMERFKRNPTDSEMDTHWQMYAREVEAKR